MALAVPAFEGSGGMFAFVAGLAVERDAPSVPRRNAQGVNGLNIVTLES